MRRLAFTLVELLIVILLISIITILGILTYKNFLNSAKNTACISKHNFVIKWFEVEMQQCRLGIQPHAEPGRGDQTYDVPPYGHITKLSRHNPWYSSCRGNIDHHTQTIAVQWGERYINPYKPDCNATIANCYSSRGFYQAKGSPSINGATNVWGYYEKLNEDINGNFNTNVHITFKSLCNGEIYKGDVITSHEYTVSQSEIDKYSEVTKEDSEENKEKAKEEDTNNYYLIEKVY